MLYQHTTLIGFYKNRKEFIEIFTVFQPIDISRVKLTSHVHTSCLL